MDLCQTARYQGSTPGEAEAAWHADHARATAAGFAQAGDARWATATQPTIEVDYEYRPPPVLVRNIVAASPEQASTAFATDATAMARAGFMPANQTWLPGQASAAGVLAFGVAGLALKGSGVLAVTYNYRPDVTGPPSAPIPPVPTPAAGPDWGRTP